MKRDAEPTYDKHVVRISLDLFLSSSYKLSMSLTAAVKFQPRNAFTSCGLDSAQVKAALQSVGVLFATGADDFSVRARGTAKDDAYFTDDLTDALATGLSMGK